MYEIETDIVGEINISESSINLVKNDLFPMFSKIERFMSVLAFYFKGVLKTFGKFLGKNFKLLY